MKTLNILSAALTLILLINFSLSAQERPEKFTDLQIKSITKGIQSENTGLKRSAIYLAGKYRIEELIPVLKSELYNDRNQKTRELILMTLGQYQGTMVNDIFADFISYTNDENLKDQAISYYLYFQSDAYVTADK